MISSASSAGEASMNLSGWNSASSASPSRSSRASSASRPMSPVSMPAHFTSSSGRSNALAMAASTSPSRRPMRSSPPRTLTMDLAVGGIGAREQLVEEGRPWRPVPRRASMAANVAATSGSVGARLRAAAWPALVRTSSTARPRSEWRSYAAARSSRVAPVRRADRGDDRRPAEAGRPLVGLGERPAGQEDGRDRQLVGVEAAQVLGQEGGLLGGPGRRRHALGQVAPAAHGGDGIRFGGWRREPGSRRS